MCPGMLDLALSVLSEGSKRLREKLTEYDYQLTPEAYALQEFIRKLYAEEKGGVSLDAVTRRVKELIEAVWKDPEQRRRLLEQREKLCKSRIRAEAETVVEMLEALSEGLEDGAEGAAAAAMAAALRVTLAQCSPRWEKLSPEERAEVLAPLYMALYHLERFRATRDPYEAEAAETLALLAQARLESLLAEGVGN